MSNARQLLLLALDPAQALRGQGLAPDCWQEQLLHSSNRHILLNCSRQSGKSTTVAALALHTALFNPDALILILSPTLRQSGELFRKVLVAYQALDRPVPAVGRSQTRLELDNGARVVCLPGREDTVRSFSGPALILIDEAARVPDDLYRSVRPMLAVSQGRLICLSTPFGQRGFFYEAWEQGGASWKRVRITAAECPRITAEFLAQERRSLGGSWVKQEYECSFEALVGLVFPDFAQQVAWSGPAPQGKGVGGLDWGYRNPFAALWGTLDGDDVLTITGERYVRETPLHDHARHLPAGVTWYADPAGAQGDRVAPPSRLFGLQGEQRSPPRHRGGASAAANRPAARGPRRLSQSHGRGSALSLSDEERRSLGIGAPRRRAQPCPQRSALSSGANRPRLHGAVAEESNSFIGGSSP
ncbi:MAG: terminase large subunit domain-containing protein [Gemmataceae bacterium]